MKTRMMSWNSAFEIGWALAWRMLLFGVPSVAVLRFLSGFTAAAMDVPDERISGFAMILTSLWLGILSLQLFRVVISRHCYAPAQ